VQRELSDEQKQRRVVLKRVNLDNAGVRSNFLRSGTMARGAAETGKVWAVLDTTIRTEAFGGTAGSADWTPRLFCT